MPFENHDGPIDVQIDEPAASVEGQVMLQKAIPDGGCGGSTIHPSSVIRYEPERVIVVNFYVKKRARSTCVDNDTHISGRNGRGKTSLLRLIPLFPVSILHAWLNRRAKV
ncbi:hypothetical protein QN379_15965 [Glaciimonas sp. Gout2]|uniref:hypothetical protein n=1 Tax=unclassified Glaciimonas TaxID=2644401 RepID=UPI002B22765F|nr:MULTISPECIES: hypothetical protein [unclassified Glaciimonas]MEB0010547.1 hypothetical protein [Glaciimonas sp. Cout2]MEB0083503.1 hypothetical protein [Glaciimonas sp. Gout2]